MKKLLLSILLLAAVSTTVFAQSTARRKFSIGLEAGIPGGKIADKYTTTIGASVKLDEPISQGTYFTASAGYTFFSLSAYEEQIARAFGIDNKGEGFVPLKAGLKHYFGQKFYGEAQVGATIYEGGGVAFAYSPGLGYTFHDHFDLGVRYEGWAKNGTISQLAARFAFVF